MTATLLALASPAASIAQTPMPSISMHLDGPYHGKDSAGYTYYRITDVTLNIQPIYNKDIKRVGHYTLAFDYRTSFDGSQWKVWAANFK
jgi:hypothetical protein